MTKEKPVMVTLSFTGSQALIDKFLRLLAMLHRSSSVGHSGLFAMWLDGDGADRFEVEPKDFIEPYFKGANAVSNVGYDVETACTVGFSGVFVNRARVSKWAYKDNGEFLEDDE